VLLGVALQLLTLRIKREKRRVGPMSRFSTS